MFLALYPSEKKRFLSKIHIIREMFDDIDLARKNGVTLILILDAIKQKSGLNISYEELRSLLYVIRKERGLNSNKNTNAIRQEPLNKNTPNKNESVISTIQKELTTDNPYDLIMEKYKQCGNQVDKYIALGGKREDIEEQNISTQRSMVMNLRNKLRQKHKGIY